MVDHDARMIVHGFVVQFMDGELDLDELFVSAASITEDHAPEIILEEVLRHFDSLAEVPRDLWEPSELSKQFVARCCAFLRSDLEYEWPKPGIFFKRRRPPEELSEVWPFRLIEQAEHWAS